MSEKRFEIMWGTVWIVDEEGEEELWNPQIVKILNEQQATIQSLQDLCGESDGENAKLRIENKKLKEENEQLRQKLDFYLLDEFEWKEKYGDD